MPPARKVLLHAITHRMSAEGEPCWASVQRLAQDAGLSLAATYKHRGLGLQEGSLREAVLDRGRRGLVVGLQLSPEQKSDLHRVWTAGRASRPPGLDEVEAEYCETLGLDESMSMRRQLRATWERAVRDSTHLRAPLKVVAWSVALSWNASGLPFQRITWDLLAARTGLHPRTTRTHFLDLESEGWIGRRVRPGERGGWWPLLRVPDGLPGEAFARLLGRDEEGL